MWERKTLQFWNFYEGLGLGFWCYTTFNNISVYHGGQFYWWRKVEYLDARGNHRPAASHWQLYHIALYRVHFAWMGFELTTLVVIGNYKSNCHTITTMSISIIYMSSEPLLCPIIIDQLRQLFYYLFRFSLPTTAVFSTSQNLNKKDNVPKTRKDLINHSRVRGIDILRNPKLNKVIQ